MISGFVILMTAERVKGAIDFLVSRAIRLYPAYWVCLFITFFVVRWLGLPGFEPNWRQLFFNLTMIQSFLGIANVDSAYWSLILEFCFYLWIAVLLLINRLDKLCYLFVGLMILGVLWHFFAAAHGDHHRPTTQSFGEVLFLLPSVHMFAAGTAIYDIYSKRTRRGLTMLAVCFVYSVIVTSPGTTILLCAFVGILAIAALRPPRILRNPILIYLGTISYTLYLVHNFVGMALIRRMTHAGVQTNLAIVIAILVALTIASIVTFTIERPVLMLAKQYRKRSAATGSRASRGCQSASFQRFRLNTHNPNIHAPPPSIPNA